MTDLAGRLWPLNPVVVHVVRPYSSEQEYLAAEAWSIDARGMLLVDAEPLAPDTAVLFDVALADGQKPIRAEGRVVKAVAASNGQPGGLRVRFKRFGAATKAFIEERRKEAPGLEKTVPEGAATSLWAGLIADPEEVGGRYAEDCAVSPVIDGDPDPSGPAGVRSYALDLDHAEALWARSEELVGEAFPR